ncbi:hypothetical protein KSP40_PGU013385 [Platanthera guangdongensis]|uniref:Uncharacterized protein n=1 Tax=Platanthera guangdongensis TaxID=2320717 RepID=A0ABR2MXB6_9ASPA
MDSKRRDKGTSAANQKPFRPGRGKPLLHSDRSFQGSPISSRHRVGKGPVHVPGLLARHSPFTDE